MLTWQVIRAAGPITLRARPFLSGRDYHSMHHDNGAFRFEPASPGGGSVENDGRSGIVCFAPYPGVPHIEFRTNGEYRHSPDWYRNFFYEAERDRGLDDTEDLATPGEFVWQLSGPGAEAVCVLRAATGVTHESEPPSSVASVADALRRAEKERRAAFPTTLDRSADAYLVRRRTGRTIVAGYPWFTDWGRDTFIALRGLCLATGRLREARDILLEWADAVSDGMLPNRFPDHGEEPEFNAVDASLWYVIAVDEFLERAGTTSNLVTDADTQALRRAVEEIVGGYATGTRFGIRLDADGLLMAGTPGVQLTWMDARVGDRVITPRIGKPVEIQALWLNAVAAAGRGAPRWREVFERGRASFSDRFWSDATGYSRTSLMSTIYLGLAMTAFDRTRFWPSVAFLSRFWTENAQGVSSTKSSDDW